jgi:cAMP-dependent protein kinase regulator
LAPFGPLTIAQAIAVAKRKEALDPGRDPLEDRLARLPLSDESVRDQLLGLIGEALKEEAFVKPPEVLRTPLFEGFTREELIEVIRGLKLLTFEPGDVVVTEGEPGESLFVVTSGRVKAFVRRPSGQSAKVRELAEGDFFGEVSILQGGRRTATITCATRCDLLELDKPALDAIAARHPGVLRVLQAFYDQRAGSTLEHMIRGV